MLPANAKTVESAVYFLDIPSQPLIESLNALSNQTRTLILFPYGLVENRTGSSVKGPYTVRKALDIILKDTGLVGGLSERNVLMISEQVSGKSTAEREKNMKNSKSLLAAIIAILAGVTGADPAYSQERNTNDLLPDRTIQEITVTASRRKESLQDVPSSISALTASALNERGITDFQDIKQIAAGLHLEETAGTVSASVRIRGVGSRGFSTVDPSVGVLVDGVYQSFPGSTFTEMLDIDRIEILRGPQGTLFGKNTTAGVIYIHTKDPELDEVSGTVQFVSGNLGAAEARGVLNLPLIEDRLAIRASGFRSIRDGFNYNHFVGEDTRNADNKGGRIKALFRPADNLDIVLSHENITTEERSDGGLARYGTLDSARAGSLSGAPLEEAGISLGKPLPEIGKFTGDIFQSRSRVQDDVERTVLTVDWDLGHHSVTSLTAYDVIEPYFFQDSDRTILDLSFLESVSETTSFTQELQLSSQNDGPLEYIFGLYYQDEDQDATTTSIDGADRAALEGRAQRNPTVITSTAEAETEAVFGNVTYSLSEEIDASLGLRYTRNEKYRDQTIGAFPVIAGAEDAYKEVTYTTRIKYQPMPDKMLYAGYSTGFKSGGFNRQNPLCFVLGGSACLSDSQLVYDPETTDSIELGWKTEWYDSRLRFNGAVFYQTYDDFQVTSSIPSALSIIITNAAEVKTVGLETDFSAVFTDKLTVDANLAYIQSEYKDYKDASCSPSVSKSATCTQDLSGEQLDNAPRWTGNVGAEYRDVLDSNLEWFARFDTSLRSSANLLETLPDSGEQPGFAIHNVRFGLGSLDDRWMVTFWGKNITDNEYAVTADDPSDHSDGLRWQQGLPRTYGVTLDLRY